MSPLCKHCGNEVKQRQSAVSRALREGKPLYCDKVCAGLARRLVVRPSAEEKKAAKQAYDAKRRAAKGDAIRAQKRAHYYANHDRILKGAAAYRKERMPLHVEYCRQPAYKAWKQQYDIAHRAKKEFGEFAEAVLTLRLIEQEVDSRATRYEVYMANGTINKALMRRRAL